MSQISIDSSADSAATPTLCHDSRSRDELIEAYRGLALSIARRRCHRMNEREDLQQVALMASINAADRFDPSREVSFSTFAWATIEGEIKRFFRDFSSPIHINRSLRERSLLVSSTVDQLTNQFGRSPTMEELAEHAGISIEAVVESFEVLRNHRPASLDGMWGKMATRLKFLKKL